MERAMRGDTQTMVTPDSMPSMIGAIEGSDLVAGEVLAKGRAEGSRTETTQWLWAGGNGLRRAADG